MAGKKTTDKKRLILLDAHAIIHRAYHALPDFSSSKGEPTGALYGLISMLLRIIADLKPDYIVACYDLPEKTFRHDAYEGYKGTRKKTDDALVAQLERSRDVFEAFCIPMYDHPGLEADDMLGTIVEQMKGDKNVEIVIASGDMDTLQLVDKKKVQVFTLKKGINDTIMYDEAAVVARFGFPPKLLPDFKGLRGDPSDNIVGIAGIGEKTATTLVSEFGTIEDIYKKLKKDEDAFTSVGIKPRVLNLLKEGEEEALFSKTLAKIRHDAPITFSLTENEWKVHCEIAKVDALMKELEFKTLLERFHKLFDSELDTSETQEESVDPERLEKARIAAWLLNSEKTNPSLSDVLDVAGAQSFDEAEKKLIERIKKEDLTYVYEEIELPLIPIIKKMQENGILLDTKYLARLSAEYHKEMEKIQTSIWKHAGEEFNINSPKQLSEILFEKMGLSTKGLKKSEGGQRSTRFTELEKLKGVHPIIDEIIAHREVQKLLSTYIDTLPHLTGEDGRLHAEFIQTGASTGRFSSMNPNLQNIPIKSELGKNIRNAFVAAPGYVLAAFDYSQIELRIAALLSGDEGLVSVFKEGKDIHSSVAAKVFNVKEDAVTSEMRRRAKVINFGIIYGMGVLALKQNLGTDRAEAEAFYHAYFAAYPEVAKYLEETKAFARKHGYTETLFGRKRYFPAIQSKIPFMRAMAERMATNAPIQGTEADVIKLAMREVDKILAKYAPGDAKLLLQVHDELIYEIREEKAEEIGEAIRIQMETIIPESFLKGKEHVPIKVGAEYAKSWGGMK